MIPKLERISPFKGMKRIFSFKSFFEFTKGIIKISIIAAVAFIAVYPELVHLQDIFAMSFYSILGFLGILAIRLMIGACAAMMMIAALDYLYQKHEFTKSLRMSKQDLREEFKQTEGNPEVKSKLRDIRHQRSKKRMMAAVLEADVVITHLPYYAIALKYDLTLAEAPIVVAKGHDQIALNIRDLAKKHGISLVENAPLVRILFNAVAVDEVIATEHYHAVAEIIRHVYSSKQQK